MCLRIRHLFRASLRFASVRIHSILFRFALHCNRFYCKSKCKYAAIQVGTTIKTLIFHVGSRIFSELSFCYPLLFTSFFSSFGTLMGDLHATEICARRDYYQIKGGWNSLWLDELFLMLVVEMKLKFTIVLTLFHTLLLPLTPSNTRSRFPFNIRSWLSCFHQKLIKSFARINCYIIYSAIIIIIMNRIKVLLH